MRLAVLYPIGVAVWLAVRALQGSVAGHDLIRALASLPLVFGAAFFFGGLFLALADTRRMHWHYEQPQGSTDKLWALAIVAFPVFGPIAWFAGGRTARIRELQAAYERDRSASPVS